MILTGVKPVFPNLLISFKCWCFIHEDTGPYRRDQGESNPLWVLYHWATLSFKAARKESNLCSRLRRPGCYRYTNMPRAHRTLCTKSWLNANNPCERLWVTRTWIERVSLPCHGSVLPLVSKANLDTFGVDDDRVFLWPKQESNLREYITMNKSLQCIVLPLNY